MIHVRFVLLLSLLTPFFCMSQQFKITGQLTDTETNQPIAAASVMNQATGAGTISDSQG